MKKNGLEFIGRRFLGGVLTVISLGLLYLFNQKVRDLFQREIVYVDLGPKITNQESKITPIASSSVQQKEPSARSAEPAGSLKFSQMAASEIGQKPGFYIQGITKKNENTTKKCKSEDISQWIYKSITQFKTFDMAKIQGSLKCPCCKNPIDTIYKVALIGASSNLHYNIGQGNIQKPLIAKESLAEVVEINGEFKYIFFQKTRLNK